MRKCIRCGSDMQEGCAVKVEGGGYGIVLSSDENKLFGGRMGRPRLPSAQSAARCRCTWRM